MQVAPQGVVLPPALLGQVQPTATALALAAMPLPAKILATPQDDAFLTPVLCLIRKQIEAFATTPADAPTRNRKGRHFLGRVGLRCVHCKNQPYHHRARGASRTPPACG